VHDAGYRGILYTDCVKIRDHVFSQKTLSVKIVIRNLTVPFVFIVQCAEMTLHTMVGAVYLLGNLDRSPRTPDIIFFLLCHVAVLLAF